MGFLPLTLGTLLVAQLGSATGTGSPRVAPGADTTAPRWPQSTKATEAPRFAGGNAAAATVPAPVNPGDAEPKRVVGEATADRSATSPSKSLAPAKIETPSKTAVPRRAVAAETIAGLFAVPVSGTLAGRPLTLLDAESAATDRTRQAAVVHAYWRLAAALGEYHVQFDAVRRLRRLEPRPDDDAALRAARANAAERLRRLELDAVRAQQGLAEVARESAGGALPLPADLPHAGPYRTLFDEVFAKQNAPAIARLIHRTLPLRRQGLEARAAAAQAAEYAWEGALDAYRDGAVDLASLLACWTQLVDQRMALAVDVCQYNHQIADYVLAVAGSHVGSRELVTMLIFPSSQGAGPGGGTENLASPQTLPGKRAAITLPSDVQPAAWNGPLGTGRTSQPSSGKPTLAPPKPTATSGVPAVLPAGPAAVPPKPIAEADRTEVPALFSDPLSDPAKDGAQAEPAPAAPRAPPDKSAPDAPVGSGDFSLRITRRMIVDGQAAAPSASAALYSGLVASAGPARVKHLCTALHWQPDLPPDAGRPVELEACLRGVSPADRRSTIDAYWVACQRAAEFRVWAEQSQLFEQFVPLVLDHREKPTGPLDMLRLRAVSLASEAEAALARVELVHAQFELTRRAGQALDGPWLIPSTVPHAGPYRLKLDAQPAQLAKQPAVQQLAASIPALAGALEEQAAVVVEADSARAAAAEAYQRNGRGIALLLTCTRSQTVETLVFLKMLSSYNGKIAGYALAVFPSAVSNEQLVQALVLRR